MTYRVLNNWLSSPFRLDDEQMREIVATGETMVLREALKALLLPDHFVPGTRGEVRVSLAADHHGYICTLDALGADPKREEWSAAESPSLGQVEDRHTAGLPGDALRKMRDRLPSLAAEIDASFQGAA